MKNELTLRRAQPEHAQMLTRIAIASKQHWGYPDRWMEIWRPQLTLSPEYILVNEIWLASVNEEAVAFCALKRVGVDWWLDHFWVLPSSIGQGLGALLFRHALRRCRRQGASVLKIESDPYAVGFYEKMGAVKVGEHRGDVDGQVRVLPILEMRL